MEEGAAYCSNCGTPTNILEQNDTDETNVTDDTPKQPEDKTNVVIAKLAKFTAPILACLYGGLSFIFLEGDFLTAPILYNMSASCYDALNGTTKARDFVIALILISCLICIIGIAHRLSISKTKDNKNGETLSIVECILMLASAITACAASGWLHGEYIESINALEGYYVDYNDYINTGSGLICFMVFGFLFAAIIIAILIADYQSRKKNLQ